MKAKHNARARRFEHRARQREARLRALLAAKLYAEGDDAVARAARADATWWRLAGTVDAWSSARFTFHARGAGEPYRGRFSSPWPGYPFSEWGPPEWVAAEHWTPLPRGRWRYVSRRRYGQLDTSAIVKVPGFDGEDYAGFCPEDRCYRLRRPTKRHRALDRWRRSVGLPERVPARIAIERGRIPSRAAERRKVRRGVAFRLVGPIVGRSVALAIIDDPLPAGIVVRPTCESGPLALT